MKRVFKKLDPRTYAKLMKKVKERGYGYYSPSRIKLARIADHLFVDIIRLFDLTSVSPVDRFLMGYAREKLYEKMQTLFQMGKKKQLEHIIEEVEKWLPEIKRLINEPDIWLDIEGKPIPERDVTQKEWELMPEPIKLFITMQEFRWKTTWLRKHKGLLPKDLPEDVRKAMLTIRKWLKETKITED